MRRQPKCRLARAFVVHGAAHVCEQRRFAPEPREREHRGALCLDAHDQITRRAAPASERAHVFDAALFLRNGFDGAERRRFARRGAFEQLLVASGLALARGQRGSARGGVSRRPGAARHDGHRQERPEHPEQEPAPEHGAER